MSVEIQMKSGYLFLAKTQQTNENIDLQELFNDYWNSNKRELLVSSESQIASRFSPAHIEMQAPLLLESIVGLWNYTSLQTIPFVSLRRPCS